MPPLPWCAWLFVYFIAARELFCAMAVPTENSDNTSRLRGQVIAIIFFSQVFSSAKIQAVASLEPRLIVAFREPRGRYQGGGSKVIAAGFVFALETLGF